MYNTCKEIVWLVNLMNKNDNRAEINEKDVFDSENNFLISEDGKDIGRDLLKRKLVGNISYIRGDNPYTFPFRIWPSEFSRKNTFNENPIPRIQYNGKKILQNMDMLSVYLNRLDPYQEDIYNKIIKTLF